MPAADAPRPRYDAYRDSGVPWLGAIPAHWSIERLKHLADVHLSSVDKKSSEDETPVRLCNYTDVYYGSQIDDASGFMEATATPAEIAVHRLRAGDVLITKDSESADDIAVPAVAARDFEDVVCGYHLAQIRPSDRLDGRYLYYAFLDPATGSQFEVAATGITRYGIGAGDIKNALFPAPPLAEQRAIAAYLDRETARLDALVAQKKRLIGLLREKRTALVSHAVTRGLDPEAPTRASGVPWIGAIPAGWEVAKLKWLTDKIGSGLTPKGGSKAYVEDGITFLRSQNVHFEGLRLSEVAYIDEETDAEMAGSRVHPQDVLLNITGASLGRCTVVPAEFPQANVNQHVCIVRAKRDRLSPSFLNYTLASTVGQQQVFAQEDGASREAITFAEIGDFVIPKPPVPEQRTIAAYLDRETARLDALEAAVREGMARLREYRTALVAAAVTGQIDVRAQAEVTAERPIKEIDTWARLNLVIELVRRMRRHKHFGRLMLVKMLYVIEHHVRVRGMRLTYRRKDYGPYDPAIKYGIERTLARQKWYRAEKRPRGEYEQVRYVPLKRACEGKGQAYFQSSWGDVADEIDRIVDCFQRFDSTRAEIVATLYAAWNDLLLEGRAATDDAILEEVLHHWHPRKKEQIAETRWRKALAWMREEGLVPSGFGTPTVHAEEE